jgi:hypothetical protein
MEQRPDHTRRLVYIAIAFAAVAVVLSFADLMPGRSALQLLGAAWEFLGALTLIFSLLYHYMGLYRMQKRSGLIEQEKIDPGRKDWIRHTPLSFAYDFGPEEPPMGQENPIDTYATMWWGTVLLVLGFLMQVVSQLPLLESISQPSTLPSSQASSWKQWMIGLFVSVVIGQIVIWPSLEFLRYWRGIQKPKGVNVPSSLTGILERLVFTFVIGIGQLPSDILTAMFAWLALKMAANWNRDQQPSDSNNRAAGAISALLAGLVSMLFAFIGGLLCRGDHIFRFAIG